MSLPLVISVFRSDGGNCIKGGKSQTTFARCQNRIGEIIYVRELKRVLEPVPVQCSAP